MGGGLQQSDRAHTWLCHSASAFAETLPCFCVRAAASAFAAVADLGYAELTSKDACCAVLCDAKLRPFA